MVFKTDGFPDGGSIWGSFQKMELVVLRMKYMCHNMIYIFFGGVDIPDI